MAATGETLTYRELDERSNQGAQLFRKLGLKAGDGIAIFMENNIRFLEICWAAQRAGLYYTCISSRLTAGEVEYIVQGLRRESADRRPHARQGRRRSGAAARRREAASWSAARSPAIDSYEDAAGAMPATRDRRRDRGRRHALFVGHDRAAQRRAPAAAAACRSTRRIRCWCSVQRCCSASTQNTIYLSPAPLYHAAPLALFA